MVSELKYGRSIRRSKLDRKHLPLWYRLPEKNQSNNQHPSSSEEKDNKEQDSKKQDSREQDSKKQDSKDKKKKNCFFFFFVNQKSMKIKSVQL